MCSAQTKSTLITRETYQLPGQPVENFTLFSRAWDECVELQVSSKDEWIGRSLLGLQSLERFEISVHNGVDTVGGLILAHDDWDPHVGPCMSVFTQYVVPEYRNRSISMRLMRQAVAKANELGYGVLAYTHRVGPWRYQTIYRPLK